MPFPDTSITGSYPLPLTTTDTRAPLPGHYILCLRCFLPNLLQLHLSPINLLLLAPTSPHALPAPGLHNVAPPPRGETPSRAWGEARQAPQESPRGWALRASRGGVQVQHQQSASLFTQGIASLEFPSVYFLTAKMASLSQSVTGWCCSNLCCGKHRVHFRRCPFNALLVMI